MEGKKAARAEKIKPVCPLFVGFIEISWGESESFDYFGCTFEKGIIDKLCFFQYNMVREIAVFCVACPGRSDHAFFRKRQFSALNTLKPAAAQRLP